MLFCRYFIIIEKESFHEKESWGCAVPISVQKMLVMPDIASLTVRLCRRRILANSMVDLFILFVIHGMI